MIEKGIRGIFITIIGTIVVMIVTTLIVELQNAQLSSGELTMLMRKGMLSACSHYAEETYKTDNGLHGSVGNAKNIVGTGMDTTIGGLNEGSNVANYNGGMVSGAFYDGNTAEEIYDKLYDRTSGNFKKWYEDNNVAGKWKSLDAYMEGKSLDGTSDDYYHDYQITPLNMGITYLDKEVLEKIAKWHIASLLSNTMTDNIGEDSAGNTFVNFKGFRVNINSLKIKEIRYEIINIDNPAGAERFKSISNMEPAKLSTNVLAEADETRNVSIAYITYTVGIEYIGLTPMREVIKIAMDPNPDNSKNKVGGMNDMAPFWEYGATTTEYDADKAAYNYTTQESEMTVGQEGDNSSLEYVPAVGYINYYVIR